MEEILFDDYGLVISKDREFWFLLYNAGSYNLAMRKEEITREQAERVMSSPREATKVLLDLQRASAYGVAS